jgi:hypothetical protein
MKKVAKRADTSACYLLHTSFVFGLLLDPENEGEMFLRIVLLLSADYTASYPRRFIIRIVR